MQMSVAAPHEVLAGPGTTQAGATAGQTPTYVLAGAPPAGVVDPLVKQEVEPQTITIRSIDPSIQHQQNIVYSIQPIPVQQTAQPITVKTEAGTISATAISPPGGVATTPKTPKTMSAKKGNKKNVWVPGKPLTPKAREMMESGKGSMNQDGRWTCVECNRSLSNEWTLEQHIQTVHGERIFNCKSCNKAFKRRDHLLNHIKTIHKGLKPCKKCNVVFVNKEELRAHKMAVHLKLAPEDTAPPPLAKNTAQEVLQYMEEETPASTPAHRAAHAAAQQQQVQQAQPVQVRSNNVVASYDNLLEGFSIPQQGGQQVVVTINPQHLAQAGVASPVGQPQQVTYQQQPISVVPVQMSQIQGGQQVAYITAPQAGQLQAQPTTIQAPQVVEMNPTYVTAAQNGTQSPVKPTITYSTSTTSVTPTPVRVKTPQPSAPSPPPQQQQPLQSQAVLTAAPTPPPAMQPLQLQPQQLTVVKRPMTIPDTLICDVYGCERGFRTAAEYTAHRELLHEVKRCHLCKQNFAGERSLIAHMRLHEAGHLYRCSLCPGTYKHQATLQAHVDLFHVPTTCLECGSTLLGSEQVQDHIAEQHAPNKILDPIDVPEQEGCNYQCSACFYAFPKRHEAERHFVETHMTTETDKVFHCCPYCKEVFLSYVRLDDHIQWEHGLEEIDENTVIDDINEQVFYQCEVCDHFFHEEKALQKHIKARHTGAPAARVPLKTLNSNKPGSQTPAPPAKLIKCPMQCGDTFLSRTDLEAHIIMSHDKTSRGAVLPVDVDMSGGSLAPLANTLHLPEDTPMAQAGDELAKAVESILGGTGDPGEGDANIDIDDINKMAAGAVISGAIDADADGVVIEDSGIVETDAAVSAILGGHQLKPLLQPQPPPQLNGNANGFPSEDEDDFEPKAIAIQPPQMKAAALIGGIKANGNI